MAGDSREEELEAEVEALREVRNKLESALRATNTYTWEWDLETDTVERHPSGEWLFGVDAAELEPVFENFLQRVHTDQRDDVEEAFDRAADEGSTYHVTYQFRTGNDEWIWLEGQGEVLLNDDGTPARIVGTTRQIPEPESA